MRKIILVGALACCSLPVFANQCNVEFSGNMQLENKILTVSLDNDSQMTIDQYKTLSVDGIALSLNTKQQQWVENRATAKSESTSDPTSHECEKQYISQGFSFKFEVTLHQIY